MVLDLMGVGWLVVGFFLGCCGWFNLLVSSVVGFQLGCIMVGVDTTMVGWLVWVMVVLVVVLLPM